PLHYVYHCRRGAAGGVLSVQQVSGNDSPISMKRLAIFFAVLGCALAALYFSQRRPASTPVSANAILNMAADAQRDLARAPLRFTHLSDAEEFRMGDELASRYGMQGQKLAAEDQG